MDGNENISQSFMKMQPNKPLKYYLCEDHWDENGEVWNNLERFLEVLFLTPILTKTKKEQETQGLGALLDKMEVNDHIKLDNIEI